MVSSACPVTHSLEASRFEATVDGQVCVADYQRQGRELHMTHTRVPAPLEGRGIAAALVRAAVDHARAEGLRIVPHCSYVRGYMQRHPDTHDVLAA